MDDNNKPTLKYLFDTVNSRYGESHVSINTLAREMGLSYEQARSLTVAAGYYYHTRVNPPVTLEEFEKKTAPKRIQMLL